ncbi:translation initiation factor IF-2 [Oryctolagus cuniculus]|uniref:translation initiation factor IF-2 n=1 Tax=Oryctolagus cuniculus TaxID=9986 RepID=UPI00222F8747|nr:translation initiation factor IF-2 [Oryctolagus cuniculus]XP_051705751.1 translation initiation factor IF-2 [Oryctolagus cuniculus]
MAAGGSGVPGWSEGCLSPPPRDFGTGATERRCPHPPRRSFPEGGWVGLPVRGGRGASRCVRRAWLRGKSGACGGTTRGVLKPARRRSCGFGLGFSRFSFFWKSGRKNQDGAALPRSRGKCLFPCAARLLRDRRREGCGRASSVRIGGSRQLGPSPPPRPRRKVWAGWSERGADVPGRAGTGAGGPSECGGPQPARPGGGGGHVRGLRAQRARSRDGAGRAGPPPQRGAGASPRGRGRLPRRAAGGARSPASPWRPLPGAARLPAVNRVAPSALPPPASRGAGARGRRPGLGGAGAAPGSDGGDARPLPAAPAHPLPASPGPPARAPPPRRLLCFCFGGARVRLARVKSRAGGGRAGGGR